METCSEQTDHWEAGDRITPILALPNEIIQEIACVLSSDADFVNMMATCRSFFHALEPPNSGVWRSRFLQLYDSPSPVASLELGYEYKFRSIIFADGATFRKGEGPREGLWLSCIITMLKETHNRPRRLDQGVEISQNISLVEEHTLVSDFLYQDLNSLFVNYSISSQFLAVQLSLTHLLLRLESRPREAPTSYDIDAVYAANDIVSGGRVDMWHALHIREFWRKHLTRPEENTFYQSYEQLEVERRPSAWTTNISPPKPLGLLWLGYYSCLHPFDTSVHQTCADGESHWTSIPVLTLELAATPDSKAWPNLFNSRYQLNSGVKTADRTYFHGIQRLHNSPFSSQHMLRGFAETCPSQGDMPGWRRIIFVVFQSRHDVPPPAPDAASVNGTMAAEEWSPGNWEMEFEWAYGYQGIILPGGKIMLGSWADMVKWGDPSSNGPFILWEVPSL